MSFLSLACVTAAAAVLARYVVRHHPHVSNPFTHLAAYFLVFYVGDWLFEATRLGSSPDASFTFSFVPFRVSASTVDYAGMVVAASCLALVMGAAAAGRFRSARPRMRQPLHLYRLRVEMSGIGCFSVAALALALFVGAVGGWTLFLQSLGDRALLFADATEVLAMAEFAFLFVGLGMGALLGEPTSSPGRRCLPAGMAVLLGLLGLATGGRFALLRVAFMVYAGYAARRGTWRLGRLAVATVVVSFLVVNSLLLSTRLEEERPDVLAQVFDTAEISQSNNLMLIKHRELAGNAQGSTVVNGLLAFIPGTLLNAIGVEKGEGGNQVFTREVFPERWARAQSEVALGFLGDFALSFGFAAAPVAAFLAGFLFMLAEVRWAGTSSLFATGARAGLALAAFQLVRGSVYNTTIGLLYVTIAVLLLRLLHVRFLPTERPPGQPAPSS